MEVKSYIQMSWIDYRLAWNTNKFDGSNRTYAKVDELWVPDITVYNS